MFKPQRMFGANNCHHNDFSRENPFNRNVISNRSLPNIMHMDELAFLDIEKHQIIIADIDRGEYLYDSHRQSYIRRK